MQTAHKSKKKMLRILMSVFNRISFIYLHMMKKGKKETSNLFIQYLCLTTEIFSILCVCSFFSLSLSIYSDLFIWFSSTYSITFFRRIFSLHFYFSSNPMTRAASKWVEIISSIWSLAILNHSNNILVNFSRCVIRKKRVFQLVQIFFLKKELIRSHN